MLAPPEHTRTDVSAVVTPARRRIATGSCPEAAPGRLAPGRGGRAAAGVPAAAALTGALPAPARPLAQIIPRGRHRVRSVSTLAGGQRGGRLPRLRGAGRRLAVAEVDVATDTILPDTSRRTPGGRRGDPRRVQLFVAETGQYHVIAVNTAPGGDADHVGPYPQDVAVSPDGSQVYATVTGGDTGPGGSAWSR